MNAGRFVLVAAACFLFAHAAAQERAAGTGEPAAVRILRVAPLGAPLNVWIGDVLAFERVGAGEWTPYTVLAAGPSPLSMAFDDDPDAGGPSAAPALRPPPSEPMGEVDLAPATYHTLLVRAGEDEDPTYVLLDDDLASLPPAGLGSLRIVHARPDVGPLALLVRPLDPDGGSRDPPPMEPLDEGSAGLLREVGPMTAGERIPLPSGRYLVWWVAPGENPVKADGLEIHLRTATAHSLVAVADEDGAAAHLLIVDAGSPRPGSDP